MQLYNKLISYDNLYLAYQKARKHKTQKLYVIEFEKNLKENLLQLQSELLLKTYQPRPLETFVIRDPKTRTISRSDFRDRVIHHALCNIIQPILERRFIHDSYANIINRGAIKAIKRLEYFKRKISKNNTRDAYILKADIKKYFETVNHQKLISILKEKIFDEQILQLINITLKHQSTNTTGKGMPLGNLTSQFFANVYLDKLDQYVKHTLKIKYYIRYVDDFVILSNSKNELEKYKETINTFLQEQLDIVLHPEKTKIRHINDGIIFLGLRLFNHHKLLKKCNIRKFKNTLNELILEYENNDVEYDEIYDAIEGWVAYAKTADTYNLRNKILILLDTKFSNEISTKEYNRHIKTLKSQLN